MNRGVVAIFLCEITFGQTSPTFFGVPKDPLLLGERIEIRHTYFDIQVSFAGDSTHIQEVESHVLRNLRSLRDVRIVPAKPFIHLYIQVADLESRSRDHIYVGSLLAVVLTYPWQDDSIKLLLGSGDAAGREALQSTETYEATSLSYAPVGQIAQACDAIVTSLDIKYLKPSRDLWITLPHAKEQP